MTSTDKTAKPASLTAWKTNKNHTITLPSGTVVEVAIPDLPQLVKNKQIPNELVDIAIGVAQGKKITRDDVEQQADFYNKLAAMTVKNPAVSEEDFSSGTLPFEDKEMLIEVATRQRDMDAVGHHIGGLERLAEFRRFRGISTFDETLED